MQVEQLVILLNVIQCVFIINYGLKYKICFLV